MEKVAAEKGVSLQVDIELAEKSRLQWNMMEHNKISALLPFQYYYKDDKVCFQYDTEGLQPITEYFQGKNGGFDILFFLCSEVIAIIERGEEYLLLSGEYRMEPEQIYWNRLERKMGLCYLPGNQGDLKQGYTALVEYLMQNADHGDERAVKLIYGLYDMLTSDCFSLEGLDRYFSGFREQTSFKERLPKREKKPVSGNPALPETEYYLVYCGSLWKDMSFWREGMGEYPLPLGEEVLVGRDGAGDVVIPYPEVSRRQAVIFQENRRFFLMDQNSTNGTYLNGKVVSGKERVLCREGDTIGFANHSFRLVCRNISKKSPALHGTLP